MRKDLILWKDVATEFQTDGSWRDIYVLGTSRSDWSRFLQALPSWSYDFEYSINANPHPLPRAGEDALAVRPDAGPLLCIFVGNLVLNCHFFTDSEIELDLDPRDLRDQNDLDQLLDFLRRLGLSVARPVVVTPENAPDCPFLRYDPAQDAFAHVR